jgi:hypothetical protein
MGIGSSFDKLFKKDAASKRRAAEGFALPELSEEQEQDMLSRLSQTGGGALEFLANTLDTAGGISRGVLAGKPLSGFTTDPTKRVSGEDLLQQYGIIDEDTNPYTKAIGGFATEVLTDPLAFISGPASALGKGGRAVKAAGLLPKSGLAAVNRMGVKKALATRTGRAASKFLRQSNPEKFAADGLEKFALTPENLKIRPLLGPRVSQTTATVRDVVEKTGGDVSENIKKVNNFLAKFGKEYQDVADDKLGGAFGLGFMNPSVAIGGQGAATQKVLDTLDSMGQAARWSYPARVSSSIFSKRVGGNIDGVDQLYAMKHFDEVKDHRALARQESARHAEMARAIPVTPQAQKIAGFDSLLSPEANNYLTRVFEGTQTYADELVTDAIGRESITNLVDSWRSISRNQTAAARRLGIQVPDFQGPNGVFYSPRTAAEADFGSYGKNKSRGTYNVNTLEAEGRQKYLMTPGGTVDLREISLLDPVQSMIARKGQSEVGDETISSVGDAIKQYLDSKHGASSQLTASGQKNMQYRSQSFSGFIKERLGTGPDGKAILGKTLPNEVITKDYADKIARFMYQMSEDTPVGTPMFSRHPLAAQTKNMISQATSRSNAGHVIRSLADAAVKVDPNMVRSNEKYMNLSDSIRKIGSKIGVTYTDGTGAGKKGEVVTEFLQSIKEKIGRELGVASDQVNLDDFAIPQSVENRLSKINDFYSSPETQSKAIEFLNQYTSLYKGFLLAFPSRHVRDMYSNAFSVWLETGSAQETLWGFNVAKKIIGGDYDGAAKYLQEIPGYPTAGAGVRQQFVDEVASSGILDTLASADVMLSNPSDTLNQLVPGSTPQKKLDFLQEFIPGRGSFDKASDMLSIRGFRGAKETKNPLLTASQKFTEYTDSVARLGGFLAMRKQGLTSSQAAERITEILVDYGSLTDIEKGVFRNIFPWYSYNSRIGAAVAKQIMTKPGGAYAQTLRGSRVLQQSDEDTYVPEALRQQFAVRIPDDIAPYLGIDPNQQQGGTNFIRNIDIPGFDALSLFDPGDQSFDPSNPIISAGNVLGSIVAGTGANLTNQMQAPLRAGIEHVTGQDMFSRRPLREATRPIDRLYKKADKFMGGSGKQNLPPFLRTMIELAPLPRVGSTLGGLADERLPMSQKIPKQLFNALSGSAMIHVPKEWQLQDAIRANDASLEPYLKNYNLQYIDKDILPELSPSELNAAALRKRLSKRLKDSRKAKEEAK